MIINLFSVRSYLKVLVLLAFLIIFLFPGISAQSIEDTFHINIQTTDSSGDIVTGTFDFSFNVTESSNQTVCEGPTVYDHSATRATDTRGIVSLYLPTVGSGGGNLSALNFDKQYYLCYSRDGTLKDVSQLGRVPYSFRATQVNLSEVDIDSNLTLGDFNVSASNGFFSFLGSLTNRITGLFVQDVNASGDVSVGGDVDVSGNVTASWFRGIFNWVVGPDSQFYLDFNGTQLDFNESNLNGTIDSRISEGQGDLHVNMSDYWNTGDRGALRNISEIMGSWFVNDLSWINFTDGDGRYVLLTDELDLNVNRSEWWRTDEGDLDNVEDILGSWISNDLAWINFTEGDTRYLLITDEANLDVNSSNFWRTNEGNKENVEDILGSEITNDLNWINQTIGNQTYVLRGGDTVSGDYIFNNNFEVGQNLTVGTNVLFVDSNNDLVGIGTVTPQNTLNVIGDINATTNVYGNVIFQDGNQVLDTQTIFGGDVSGTYDVLELGTGVVGTINLANGSVTDVKIAPDSVNTTHIVDGTIINEDISASADIDWSKLNNYPYVIAGSGLTDGGQLSGNVTLNVGAGTGIIVNADEVSLNTTFTDERYVEVAGDTMTGNLVIDANLTVGTNLLFADSTGALVGIGTVNPQNKLNVVGDINATETIYAGEFSGPINWTFLQNYPNACPEGQVVQEIGDTLTCVDVDPVNVVNGTGTIDYIPRWIANNSLGDSIISQDSGSSTVIIDGNLNLTDLVASGNIDVLGNLNVGTDLSVSGSTDVDGNLTIGVNALFVDSDNNVVGIGTITPQNALNVIGDGNFTGDVYADSFVEGGQSISDKYVLKAGDTITGALNITGSDPNGIALNVTSDLIVNESSGRVGLPGLTALRILSLDANRDIVSTGLVTWISGTSDQISVTDDGNGGVELSLPQDINSTSSPTFLQLTLSGLSQGSVVFAGANGLLSQDNTNFYWNDTSNRLGIGTNNPQNELNVEGDVNVTDNLYVGNTRIFTDGNGDTVFRLNG